jgi:hypothetical protein
MLDEATAVVPFLKENDRMLASGSAVHQVLWVEHWPQTDTPIGFLTPLVSGAGFANQVTLIFEPVGTEKAEREYQRQAASHESAVQRDQWLGRPSSPGLKAEGDDLEARAQELASGFGTCRFCAFVVVSAPDREQLADRVREARRLAARLKLTVRWGDQNASFDVAGLPLGLGVRRP